MIFFSLFSRLHCVHITIRYIHFLHIATRSFKQSCCCVIKCMRACKLTWDNSHENIKLAYLVLNGRMSSISQIVEILGKVYWNHSSNSLYKLFYIHNHMCTIMFTPLKVCIIFFFFLIPFSVEERVIQITLNTKFQKFFLKISWDSIVA